MEHVRFPRSFSKLTVPLPKTLDDVAERTASLPKETASANIVSLSGA